MNKEWQLVHHVRSASAVLHAYINHMTVCLSLGGSNMTVVALQGKLPHFWWCQNSRNFTQISPTSVVEGGLVWSQLIWNASFISLSLLIYCKKLYYNNSTTSAHQLIRKVCFISLSYWWLLFYCKKLYYNSTCMYYLAHEWTTELNAMYIVSMEEMHYFWKIEAH